MCGVSPRMCGDLRPGKLPCPLHRDELNLGDIFLGVEFVMKQCQRDSLDLHGALTVITAHGICHLLGYRHETEEEWTEMLQRESYILSEYNRLTGRHLEPLTKRCTQDR
ncbi:endoribonuclease YbeY-like [Morone saxatilis]|uniref:endoribonuclease YbeY-like n=1 Tax=Morone saxatilis TaxID=34816 RepID=UPI0015E1D979|nr:endoribonuclease YbeY-like [Morone saxatilis]